MECLHTCQEEDTSVDGEEDGKGGNKEPKDHRSRISRR